MHFLLKKLGTFFVALFMVSTEVALARSHEPCDSMSIRSLIHLGNHHVLPFTNAEVRLVWESFNAARIFEATSSINADGRAEFNKSEFTNFVRREAKGSWDGVLTIEWKLPTIQISNLQFLNNFHSFYLSGSKPNPEYVTENSQVVKSLFSPENCSDFVPTVAGEGNSPFHARAMRNVFGSIWAIQQAKEFLVSTVPSFPLQERKPVSTNFQHAGTNSSVSFNSSDSTSRFFSMQVGLQSDRGIFLMLHELGHILAINHLALEVEGGEHSALGCYSLALALTEGWAHFFAIVVLLHHNPNATVSYVDELIFENMERNFPAQNPSNSFVVSIGQDSLCPKGLDNERDVQSALLSLVREAGLSFPQVWGAMQVRNGTKISSFRQFTQILMEKYPEFTSRIRNSVKKHGF